MIQHVERWPQKPGNLNSSPRNHTEVLETPESRPRTITHGQARCTLIHRIKNSKRERESLFSFLPRDVLSVYFTYCVYVCVCVCNGCAGMCTTAHLCQRTTSWSQFSPFTLHAPSSSLSPLLLPLSHLSPCLPLSLVFALLGIEPTVSSMLGKHFSTELHP